MPRSSALRVTARMAAFMPGASPPLVRTAMCFISPMLCSEHAKPGKALFDGSRVVDGEGEMLGWLRGCGHQAHPVWRLETVPRPLRDDHDHAGFERMGLRSVVRHDVEGHRAVDDLHDLVAVWMALPRTFAGELGDVDGAVAVRRQARKSAHTTGIRCLRGASAQPLQLGELRVGTPA